MPKHYFPLAVTAIVLIIEQKLSSADQPSPPTNLRIVQATSPLVAHAGPDKSILPGGFTVLEGSASGGIPPYSYSWSPVSSLSNPLISQPIASPKVTTTYSLAVRDSSNTQAWDDVLVILSIPSGLTYYVDKNNPLANDANPGSQDLPWKTLVKAGKTAKAGSTVVVKSGVYQETLIPSFSGSSESMITFKGSDDGSTVIDGKLSRSNAINLTGRVYIRIENFEICNHIDDAIVVQDWYSNTSKGHQIIHNYIHNNGDFTGWNGGGIAIQASNLHDSLIEGNNITMNGDTAIRLGGLNMTCSNVIIRNNNIHHNGRDGISGGGTNLIIENNKFYDNCHTSLHQDALQLSFCNGITIRNNIFSDFTQLVYGGLDKGDTTNFVNLRVYGNIFYNSIYWTTKSSTCPAVWIDCRGADMNNLFGNIEIHSNTFLYLGENQKAILLYGNPTLRMSNIMVFNNIFYECRGNRPGIAMDWSPEFTNVISDYNCFYRMNRLSGYDVNGIFDDPKFINYVRHSSYDVRLSTNSPCINTGIINLNTLVTLPPEFNDIDGVLRPQGSNFDIGAFEFK